MFQAALDIAQTVGESIMDSPAGTTLLALDNLIQSGYDLPYRMGPEQLSHYLESRRACAAAAMAQLRSLIITHIENDKHAAIKEITSGVLPKSLVGVLSDQQLAAAVETLFKKKYPQYNFLSELHEEYPIRVVMSLFTRSPYQDVCHFLVSMEEVPVRGVFHVDRYVVVANDKIAELELWGCAIKVERNGTDVTYFLLDEEEAAQDYDTIDCNSSAGPETVEKDASEHSSSDATTTSFSGQASANTLFSSKMGTDSTAASGFQPSSTSMTGTTSARKPWLPMR